PAWRRLAPRTALRRADAVVLASGASEESLGVQKKMVWRVKRAIIAQGIPMRPVVFCGIARPQNFLLQLRAANVEPAAQAFYRDHHAYNAKAVSELRELKPRGKAGGFVTAEKNGVKLELAS